MGTTFPRAYSQNVAEAWSIKDGHLHSTLTPFTRLGQQQDRWHIGISNIATHHAWKGKEQNFASKSVLKYKLLKLHRIPLPIQTKCPRHDFAMAKTPDTLSLWALFLWLLLLRHSSLACSDLDQLPLVAKVVLTLICLVDLAPPSGYCSCCSSPCSVLSDPPPVPLWSCLARHLVLASAVELFFHPLSSKR